MPRQQSRLRSVSATLVALLMIVLTTAATANGTPGFPASALPPFTLTATGETSFYKPDLAIAANPSGATVAAWTVSRERLTKGGAGPAKLFVSFRAAGATAWSVPTAISAPDRVAGRPQVGIDAAGVATIAWQEFSLDGSSPDSVRVAAATAGSLGNVQSFTADKEALSDLTLEVSPTGAAVLAYGSSQRAGSTQVATGVVHAARRATALAPFSAATALSTDAANVDARAPDVAINAAGAVSLAWQEAASSGPGRIRFAQATGPGAWSTPVDITDGVTRDAAAPRVALDPAGTTTVLWVESGQYSASDRPFAVVARRVAAAGGLEPRQEIATGSSSAIGYLPQMRIGVDATGHVTAAWTKPSPSESSSSQEAVQVASAAAGDTFGAPITLTDIARSTELALAVDPSGATAVGVGGDQLTLGLYWRAPGAAAFSFVGPKVSDKWVRPVAIAFGRTDEITVLFGTDLAPSFVVQTATTSPEPAPTPTPTLDTTPATVTIGAISKVLGPKPKKRGKKRTARLVVVVAANEVVEIRAQLSQIRKGMMRKNGTCGPVPTSRKQRRGKTACTRTVLLGPTVVGPAGPAGATLDLGAAPPKGTYSVTVKATDLAGNRSAPVSKSFTVK